MTIERTLVLGQAGDEPHRITAYYAAPVDDPDDRLPIVHAYLTWREAALGVNDGYASIVQLITLAAADKPEQVAQANALKLEILKSLSAIGDALIDWNNDGVLYRVVRHDGGGTLIRWRQA